MASAKDVEARQLVLSTIEQRKQTWEILVALEQQIYNFESTYMGETVDCGNVHRGFDHLVDLAGCDSETARSTSLFVSGSRDGGVSNKRPPKKTYFKEMDRLFSLSSVTSPTNDRVDVNKNELTAAELEQKQNAGSGGRVNMSEKPSSAAGRAASASVVRRSNNPGAHGHGGSTATQALPPPKRRRLTANHDD